MQTAERSWTERMGPWLPALVTAAVVLLVVGSAVRLGLQNPSFVANHPMNLVWIGGGLVAGGIVFLANGARVGLRDVLPWLGFGVLATYIGFALQGNVNGSLVRAFGSAPGLAGFTVLGLGAATCQTFGKWIVLRVLSRVGSLATPRGAAVVGLAVGLGFGLAEVVILGESLIARRVGITVWPWLGIWERGSAVGLHVFSAAALAFGLYRKSWIPVLVVLLIHTADDAVAGALSGGALALPAIGAQLYFTIMTIAMWAYYRTLKADVLAEETT